MLVHDAILRRVVEIGEIGEIHRGSDISGPHLTEYSSFGNTQGMALTETSYLVLVSLQDGPQHGYAILQKAAGFGLGAAPPVATLYATLERLKRSGLIAQEREEIVEGRARRFFVLTDEGAAALHEEGARLLRAAVLVKPAAKQSRRNVVGSSKTTTRVVSP